MDLPLGCITAETRNDEQNRAHAAAASRQIAFSLAPVSIPVGTKVMLTDFWKDPRVVADIGFEFNGFYQFKGVCVGVSAGNGIFTLSAIQRCLADSPTKAFVPWWPFNYASTRRDEGDRGPGEGAVVSVMLENLKQGVFAENQPGLPTDLPDFKRTNDGLQLSASIEMQYSDGGKIDPRLIKLAQQFPVGSVAPLHDPSDIATSVVNGYPVNNGCNLFVSSGKVKGNGDTAYVVGKYDKRGGHATCFLGVWHHPNDGMLYQYSNQWPTQVYPTDPAGAGRCCMWLPESEVEKAFKQYGMRGEIGALSHLNYMPSQSDRLMSWKNFT